MAEYENRREFERYPVSFEVQVSSLDENGKQFTETGIIKDISGGGARLLTDHAEHYFIGQKINLKIVLPAAEALKADMRGRALVVWIAENSEDTEESSVSIGLSMYDLLAFEHLIKGS